MQLALTDSLWPKWRKASTCVMGEGWMECCKELAKCVLKKSKSALLSCNSEQWRKRFVALYTCTYIRRRVLFLFNAYTTREAKQRIILPPSTYLYLPFPRRTIFTENNYGKGKPPLSTENNFYGEQLWKGEEVSGRGECYPLFRSAPLRCKPCLVSWGHGQGCFRASWDESRESSLVATNNRFKK